MKNHSLLYFLIFICSLMLGYSISIRFYPTNIKIHPSTEYLTPNGTQSSIEQMKNGQRSILLISTQVIDANHSELKSIWLASYFTTDTIIQLLPIYPAGNRLNTTLEQQLIQSFGFKYINNNLVLNQTFINLLKNDNYWWSGYIVFDEIALKMISDLVDKNDQIGTSLNGRIGVDGSISTQFDTQAAYSSQIALLQSACHKFREISADAGVPRLNSQLLKHIATDIDLSQLQSEVQYFLSEGQKPTCRFPTLEISKVVH